MALPVLPDPSNFLGVALVINRSRDGPRFVFHYPAHVLSGQERSGSGTDDEADSEHERENGHSCDNDYDCDEDDGLAAREARQGRPPAGLETVGGGSSASAIHGRNRNRDRNRNWDDHLIAENGAQIVPWEHVAGFPTKALAGILTPARAYHKTLFQVSLDPIYCVSYPIYAPENGVWKKKSKKDKKQKEDLADRRKDKNKKTKSKASSGREDNEPLPLDPDGRIQKRDISGRDINTVDFANVDSMKAASASASASASTTAVAMDHGNGTTRGDGDDQEDDREGKEDKVSSMTMFNLVFFLNPKKHEVKELINTMYTHIIRKVNKAYKYCQQRNDFVWKESKRILAMKDKAREDRKRMTILWNEILATSSLAASMQDVYEAISQNKIAVLQLETQEGAVTHSVQIPVPFRISDLPPREIEDQTTSSGEAGGERARGGGGGGGRGGSRDPSLGLWITTANCFVTSTFDGDVEREGEDGGRAVALTSGDGAGAAAGPGEPDFLDKNFALLLMDDDKKIVSELRSDPDNKTAAMIEFMKHSKPTLSFHQVAKQSELLNLAQVRRFAHHFIFWRRAIAIPPLHMKDVYVLSPNCDLSKLARATQEMARAFPWGPALPNMLADLSAGPRAFKTFCLNKNHRPQWLRMLAWLLRGGWITQICTFAYVVVWPEIIYEVEHALEAEELIQEKARQAEGGSRSNNGNGSPVSRSSSVSQAPDDTPGGTSRSSSPNQSEALSSSSSSSSSTATLDARSPTTTTSATAAAATAPSTYPHAQPPPAQPQPTTAQQAAETARLSRKAEREARELAEKASAHARKPQPAQTAHPSVNNAAHLGGIHPHVILDAKTATGKESLYLSAIARRLRAKSSLLAAEAAAGTAATTTATPTAGTPTTTSSSAAALGLPSVVVRGPAEWGGGGGTSTDDITGNAGRGGSRRGHHPSGDGYRERGRDGGGGGTGLSSGPEWDARVADKWPHFCRYFNGRNALERIALQEEMKRKDAWNLLTAMSEYLLCVRHW